MAELLREKLGLREKEDFIATRKGLLDPKSLTWDAYQALIPGKSRLWADHLPL